MKKLFLGVLIATTLSFSVTAFCDVKKPNVETVKLQTDVSLATPICIFDFVAMPEVTTIVPSFSDVVPQTPLTALPEGPVFVGVEKRNAVIRKPDVTQFLRKTLFLSVESSQDKSNCGHYINADPLHSWKPNIFKSYNIRQ